MLFPVISLFVLLAATQITTAAPDCVSSSVMTCLMPVLSYFMGPGGQDLAKGKNSTGYTDEQFGEFCRLGISFFDCYTHVLTRCAPGATDAQQFIAKTAQLIRKCDNPTFGSHARSLIQCMNSLELTKKKTVACSNAAFQMTMNDVRSLMPKTGGRMDLSGWNSSAVLDSMCCNTKYFRRCSGSEISEKCGPPVQKAFDSLQEAVLSTYDCTTQTSICPERPDPSPEDYNSKMDFTTLLAASTGGMPPSQNSKIADAKKPSEKTVQNKKVPAVGPTTPSTRTNESSTTPSYSPCEGMWKYPENCDPGNSCIYSASWNFLDDSDAIHFIIKSKVAGWTGIGFNADRAMKNADAIIGWVTPRNTVAVTDRHCIDNRGAPLDEDQSVYDVAGRREEGYQVIEFTRKLDTQDPNGHDFVFSDQNCPFFIFPVVGGAYDRLGGIQAHSLKALPKISAARICVGRCSAEKPVHMIMTFRFDGQTWIRQFRTQNISGWVEMEEQAAGEVREVLRGAPGYRRSRVVVMRPSNRTLGLLPSPSTITNVGIIVYPTTNQTSAAAAMHVREILTAEIKTGFLGMLTVDPDSLTISDAEQIYAKKEVRLLPIRATEFEAKISRCFLVGRLRKFVCGMIFASAGF